MKFGEGTNTLKDYLFTSNCVVWQDDQIKILSLPDKGKLFYLTNPNFPTPIYAECFLGQMIVVRDILDNKVLKFQAEGFTDNAFTGTYMTMFKFERFCGQTASNVVTHLSLSMVDDMTIPVEPSKLVIRDIVFGNNNDGTTTYNLEVTGSTYNGFMFSQISSLSNIYSATLNNIPFSNDISIAGLGPEDEAPEVIAAVSIPVGVYNCVLQASATALSVGTPYYMAGSIDYRMDQGYAEGHKVDVFIEGNME